MRQHLRHHIYADDMQLYANSMLKDVLSMLLQLQNCITEDRECCSSTMLKQNQYGLDHIQISRSWLVLTAVC